MKETMMTKRGMMIILLWLFYCTRRRWTVDGSRFFNVCNSCQRNVRKPVCMVFMLTRRAGYSYSGSCVIYSCTHKDRHYMIWMEGVTFLMNAEVLITLLLKCTKNELMSICIDIVIGGVLQKKCMYIQLA